MNRYSMIPYPDKRHIRAQNLAAYIMQEISQFLSDEMRRDVIRAIEKLLWREGVEILTDHDRVAMGLPKRNNDRWTEEELMALDLRRQELMLKSFGGIGQVFPAKVFEVTDITVSTLRTIASGKKDHGVDIIDKDFRECREIAKDALRKVGCFND